MRILVFAGTQEGKLIARSISEHQIEVDVCVATSYGEACLMEDALLERNADYLHCHTGRLATEEMEELMQQKEYVAVIDATHPFATKVSESIREACNSSKLEYIRFSRESEMIQRSDRGDQKSANIGSKILYVEDVMEAAEKLAAMTNKKILFTTGSKDIKQLTSGMADKEGVYVRILPAMESLQLCEAADIPRKNVIAMQGPFSMELNQCLLKELHIDVLVTKESGAAGGYPEKIRAAAETEVEVLVIRNPEKKKSYQWNTLWDKLEEITGKSFQKNKCNTENGISAEMKKLPCPGNLTVIGFGPGDAGQLTYDARQALLNADIIFGAESILKHVPQIYADHTRKDKHLYEKGIAKSQEQKELRVPMEPIYQKEQIFAYLGQHQEYRKAVLVCSGDVGFFSGAAAFQNRTIMADDAGESETKDERRNIRMMPGISSLVYLCAKIGTPWQDVAIASIHGRQTNVIGKVRTHSKVFVLVSGKEDVKSLAHKMKQYHMEYCKVTVGYQLSSWDEQIAERSVEELCDEKMSLRDGLYVLLIQNQYADKAVMTPGISDEEFIRGTVPMTKEEVREVSIAKLHLQKDSVLFDIGTGTGSVSIEAARVHDSVKVYAIEKNPEAVALLHQNKMQFAADNLTILEGTAPEILDTEELDKPTHAFIGGSNGNLSTIIHKLLERNPQIRIVINTVTLETLSEVTTLLQSIPHKKEDVTQVSVTKTRLAGNYHLMQAANPVMVIAFEGDGFIETTVGR